MAPQFLTALDKEQAEFVRPALVRALAPSRRCRRKETPGTTSRARGRPLVRDVGRGEDFFRALSSKRSATTKRSTRGRTHRRRQARRSPAGRRGARAGKIGGQKSARDSGAMQRSAPRETQPAIATAICLLGVNCESHEGYLVDTLKFSDKNSGFRSSCGGAATGLGALVSRDMLRRRKRSVSLGVPSARSDACTGGSGARDGWLCAQHAARHDHVRSAREREPAIVLLARDSTLPGRAPRLDKEAPSSPWPRRTYWESPESSPRRVLMQTLIAILGLLNTDAPPWQAHRD